MSFPDYGISIARLGTWLATAQSLQLNSPTPRRFADWRGKREEEEP